MERSPGWPWERNRQVALLGGVGFPLLALLMVEQHRPEMVLGLALTAAVAVAVRAAHPPNRHLHRLFELALLLSIAAAAASWYAEWWPSTWLAHFTTAAFAGAVLFDLQSRDGQWRASKGSAVMLTTTLGLAAAGAEGPAFLQSERDGDNQHEQTHQRDVRRRAVEHTAIDRLLAGAAEQRPPDEPEQCGPPRQRPHLRRPARVPAVRQEPS